ncbi:MAG: HAD family phosphatase [Lachnospiraceae bacterium]|nr:HAD family phosphatase [Lachnospiraceae bacterium]
MDGLILDSERVYDRAMVMSGSSFGYALDENFLKKTRGVNGGLFAQMIYGEFGKDFPLEKFRDRYREIIWEIFQKEGLGIKPGFKELHQYLIKKKLRYCLATSTNRQMAKRLLHIAGIRDVFHSMICGDEVTLGKPHPEIYRKAAAMLDVEPAECVVLEDSVNGIKAGYAAGCQVIMIPDLTEPSEEIEMLCECVCRDLFEVIGHLESSGI